VREDRRNWRYWTATTVQASEPLPKRIQCCRFSHETVEIDIDASLEGTP